MHVLSFRSTPIAARTTAPRAVRRRALAAACLAAAVGCDIRDEPVRSDAAPQWPTVVQEPTRPFDGARADDPATGAIQFVEGYEAAARRATAERLPLLLVCRADWCRWSDEATRGPLADRDVVARSRRCVCVLVDADRDAGTCREFGVTGFPTVILVDAAGRERFRSTGVAAAGGLAAALDTLSDRDRPASRVAGGRDPAR